MARLFDLGPTGLLRALARLTGSALTMHDAFVLKDYARRRWCEDSSARWGRVIRE